MSLSMFYFLRITCSDEGKPHLIERIESRNGIHTVDAAYELGCGNIEYELIEVK